MPHKFNRINTKVGSVKYTRTWVGDGKGRKTVPVEIERITEARITDYMDPRGPKVRIWYFWGRLPNGETIRISQSGSDGRFWGGCYHTREEADRSW